MTDTNVWRDISTAPKDGTRILIYQPPLKVGQPTHTTLPASIYVAEWTHTIDGSVWLEPEGERYQAFTPTHWMPLPEPPNVEPLVICELSEDG